MKWKPYPQCKSYAVQWLGEVLLKVLGACSRVYSDTAEEWLTEPLPGRVATVSPLSGQVLLERLSYSHLELLIEIDDPWDAKNTIQAAMAPSGQKG